MRTDLFDYDLPEELIADCPPESRDGGRMCIVREAGVDHALVKDFPEQLGPSDLLVLNETKVRSARLFCEREHAPGAERGAKVELLFLEKSAARPGGVERWSALGRANRPLRAGDRLRSGETSITIAGRGEGGLFEVDVAADVEALLARTGQLPIPPYMKRAADDRDAARYQTVFAKHLGSAAAPTAGLHLTTDMLARIRERGVRVEHLTLHVGIGTFRPVTSEDLDDHAMHDEAFEVPPALAAAIEHTREQRGRVVAVGTTVVRALEAAADPTGAGTVRAAVGRTELLIQPGYSFRIVDALLTNFHMPRSTLLALVSAFAGRERLFRAYRAAVDARYRFLSYGDAMWIPERLTDRNV